MFVALDRDGTIIDHVHHLIEKTQIKLIPGAGDSIRKLNEAGIPVVVLTNQSVVGRGMISLDDLNQINEFITEQFNSLGATIEFFLTCPHVSNDFCQCRKPNTGLLSSAAEILKMKTSQAIIIGDSESDMEMASRVRTIGLHVKTGVCQQSIFASLSFLSIVEAVDYILEEIFIES